MINYFSTEQSSKRESEVAALLGKDILEGESMRRLRGVSFLGVLNIAAHVPESLQFSRYEHSISVAYLTWKFCQNFRIREDISFLATLAALIHDITHPPFSHSTEVYLQIRSGSKMEHSSVLTEQKITKVIKEGYSLLPRSLQREEPEKIAQRLYRFLSFREERSSYHVYLADIIDTPFCPDTFDGINRAWNALNSEETKYQLTTNGIPYLESIDPMSLIRFISSTTPYPFVFSSESPPSKANLIYRFHNLMRILYNDVIYSDWQSSAMVMFARTLEVAYKDVKKFMNNQIDTDVIKRIKKIQSSNDIYNLILTGQNFYSLRKENPSLYQRAVEYYTKTKNQKTNKEIRKTIEKTIANKLKLNADMVFLYKFRPLIWSSSNIEFKEFGKSENLWKLIWETSEGKPSDESKIEIYYAKYS